jgi:Rod binding domain-containing protein
MDISNIQSKVNAADIPLKQMNARSQLSQEQKMGEVGRQFEAILLRQILSEAHKTQTMMGGQSSSSVGDIYNDMVTNQLADNISRTNSLGLSQVIQKQLGRQFHAAEGAGSGSAGEAATTL